MSGWHDPQLAAEWDAIANRSLAREDQLGLLVAALEEEQPSVVLEVGVGSGRQMPVSDGSHLSKTCGRCSHSFLGHRIRRRSAYAP